MLRHGLSECEAGFKLIRGQASSYTRDKCEMCELGKLALGRASFDPVHASYGRLDTCVDCKELAGVECQGGVLACACVHATRIAPPIMKRIEPFSKGGPRKSGLSRRLAGPLSSVSVGALHVGRHWQNGRHTCQNAWAHAVAGASSADAACACVHLMQCGMGLYQAWKYRPGKDSGSTQRYDANAYTRTHTHTCACMEDTHTHTHTHTHTQSAFFCL